MRAGVAAAALALLLPLAASAQTDAERDRERLEDQRADVDDEIDVLEASNSELERALDGIDSAIASQQAAVDAAQAEVVEAEARVDEAEESLAAARADVEMLRLAVQEMAIASYIHPPAEDLVHSFTVADFSDAIIARTYLDARAKRDANLLNLLRAAEATAETRAAESQRAAAAASEAVETAESELLTLQSERARQQNLVADVQTRIDNALAESAALADIDAELSAQIAAEQTALIERIPPAPEPATALAAAPAAQTPVTEPAAPTTTAPGAPPETTPPTTAPPAPPPNVSTPPLRTVYGITVHADIANNVARLIEAAQAAGISLGGGGYRSPDAQIATRRANCGTSDYAIYHMPSGQCSPPTAPPGTSMHERGLAIDFTAGGQLIRSRDSDGFRWLAANAGSYGLRNLPVEPWHWSTTGN